MSSFENKGYPGREDYGQPQAYYDDPPRDDPPRYNPPMYNQPTYNPVPNVQQQATVINMNQPGQPHMVMDTKPPQEMLACSILTCIFCNWPVGVCAIHNSCKVKESVRNGNLAEARVYASVVKKHVIFALIIGLIAMAIYCIYYFAYYKPKMEEFEERLENAGVQTGSEYHRYY